MLPSCRLPAQRCPRVMGESWMVCPSVFSSAADHIGWARWAHLQPVRSQVQLWHLWDSFGFEWGGRSTGNQNWEVEDMTYVTCILMYTFMYNMYTYANKLDHIVRPRCRSHLWSKRYKLRVGQSQAHQLRIRADDLLCRSGCQCGLSRENSPIEFHHFHRHRIELHRSWGESEWGLRWPLEASDRRQQLIEVRLDSRVAEQTWVRVIFGLGHTWDQCFFLHLGDCGKTSCWTWGHKHRPSWRELKAALSVFVSSSRCVLGVGNIGNTRLMPHILSPR